MRDPETLSRAERALWRDNLLALVIGTRPADYLRDGGVARGWRWITVHDDDPLDEELHDLWQRTVLLVNAHQEPVRLPSLTGGLSRLPADPDAAPKVKTPYVRLARSYRAEDFEAALLHAVADLLIACERLRECQECHRLFVANRKQEFHKVCARRKRDRDWNEARKQKGKP